MTVDNKPKFTIFTMFPEVFPATLGLSVLGRGIEDGKWKFEIENIRNFSIGKDIDDTPYGGGSGMVLLAEVLHQALCSRYKNPDNKDKPLILYLSPRGVPLTQNLAIDLSKTIKSNTPKEIALICGRFEGVDQRVLNLWQIKEVSIGDYVLAGGEAAALVLIESVVRLLPGILGNQESLANESFSNGLLEHNHYTKPQEWQGMKVPEVLTNGNHGAIDKWRKENSLEVTHRNRPTLLPGLKQKIE